MDLFREERGSGLWSGEFVKLEGKVGLMVLAEVEQKHETFSGQVGFGGEGRVCFFRTLRICTPKSVTRMISHRLRNEGKFDTAWNQHTELVVQMYLQHNGILWNII